MGDKDLNNQLEGLFSGHKDLIWAIKPPEPTTVVDKKRQQAQLRDEEQLTISLGTKGGGERVVEKATGTQIERPWRRPGHPTPAGTPDTWARPMELGTYLAILRRRKWVIAVTLAVTVTVVVVGTLMMTPKYTASTTLRVATALGGSVDYGDYMYAERLINTYAEIATSGPVLEELVQRLGLDEPPEIEVEIVADTELMQITVEDPDPILAREAANALAEILVARSRELYSGGGKTAQQILSEQLSQIEDELDQARREYESLVAQSPEDSERITAASRSIELKQQIYATLLKQYEQTRLTEAIQANALSVVEPAVAPQAPSKPRQELNIALGFMVGLAGGLGLAFLFENLDATLYTTGQIEEVTALSTLAKIPTARRQRQIVFFNDHSPQGEAFRRLRTNIFALDHDVPLHTLLVTSAESREGKSTVVANLALAMAQSGRKVVVVDADLRRPALHKVFDLSNEIGLSSILRQEATLDEALRTGLYREAKVQGGVLTSGPLPPNPAELLGSPQMTALIGQLTQQFDMVVLDTPSLLAVTDAAVLAQTVDGVVLVVGRAQARQEAVRAARQHLADVKANSIGVVVNRAEQDGSYHYYHRTPVVTLDSLVNSRLSKRLPQLVVKVGASARYGVLVTCKALIQRLRVTRRTPTQRG